MKPDLFSGCGTTALALAEIECCCLRHGGGRQLLTWRERNPQFSQVSRPSFFVFQCKKRNLMDSSWRSSSNLVLSAVSSRSPIDV